jgi:hypothetical protein
VTTRRGPGVPGVEHGTVPALPEDAGGQAVDLAAIRRAGTLVDLLRQPPAAGAGRRGTTDRSRARPRLTVSLVPVRLAVFPYPP